MNIREYVFKVIKNYFWTTYHEGIQEESELSNHGLDMYDLVEIAMQIEEDLGYFVPAENLAIFSKPKHFINYINQIEGFKKDWLRAPAC